MALPPSAIEIRESRFVGQRPADPGISNFAIQVRSQDVSIDDNTFLDCGDRCVNVSGVFQFTDNVMADCGTRYCIQTVGRGTVARNEMSNAVTGAYDSFFHHVLLLLAADVVVENNDIDGCGHGQCITAVLRSTGEIRNNRITARHGERTRIAIVLSDNAGGNDERTDRGSTLSVTGNAISGMGGNAGIEPDNPEAYAYNVAAFVNEGHSTLTANQNTINGANYGFITRTGSVTQGTRNVVTTARVGIGAFDDASRTQLNWNDIIAFRAFDVPDETDTDITCNWWDGAPSNFFGAPSRSVYTPWANQPVAATGSGECTGGLAAKKGPR